MLRSENTEVMGWKAATSENAVDDDNDSYIRGYQKALEDINNPMLVIQKKWSPSECPRCHMDFSEFEECDDGYYDRATSRTRCPYCGQKLKWEEFE